MAGNRTQNSIRNGITGLINKVLLLLGPFIIRSAILYSFGANYIGLGSLFASIIQIQNVAELGFASAIVYSMYKPIAEGNEPKICALLAYYRKAYRIIGTIVLLSGLCFMPFLKDLIKSDYPLDINIYYLYMLYLANTVISYYLFAYKSCIFTANQRNDILNRISSATHIVQYIIQIVIILVIKNYYLYFLFTPIATALNNCLVFYEARKKFPSFVPKGKLSAEDKEEVGKHVGGLIIQKISSVSRDTFDSIFISAFMGLTMVAIYSNYYYVMSCVCGIMGVAVPSLVASVGNSIVTENQDKNYHFFRDIEFGYFWIASVFSVCMYCLYQPFMTIWAGEELLLPEICIILFCIYFFQNTYGDIIALYTQATGLWWKIKNIYIFNAVINMILNYALVRLWGVSGIVFASILAGLFFGGISLGRILFKNVFTKFSYTHYLLVRLRYITITGIMAGTMRLFTDVIADSLLTFFLKGVICIVLSNICLFLIFRNNIYFQDIVVRLKKLIIKKRYV